MCGKHQELLQQARETCIASWSQEEAASSQAGEWVEQGTSGEGGEQGGKSILGLETIEDSLMKAWGQAGEISEVMEERGRGHQSPPVVSTQTRGAGSRAW